MEARMLKQRVLTALVLSGVLLAVLFAAPVQVFILCMAMVCALAAWEWAALAQLPRLGQVLFVVATLGGAGLIYTQLHQALTFVWLGALAIWCCVLLWVSRYPRSTDIWANRPVRSLLGLGALLPTLLAFWFLRQQEQGVNWVVLLLCIVATADSGAYFAGRAFGKRKLAPAVSPGKSWEGVLGGWAGALLLALVVAAVSPTLTLLASALLVMPAAMISVLGDLLESMLKRQAGVKDSGSLLPGHGGFLDRIDGLTAAAPVFALCYVQVLGA
jgi:phosphatidate cytidylyltransferase